MRAMCARHVAPWGCVELVGLWLEGGEEQRPGIGPPGAAWTVFAKYRKRAFSYVPLTGSPGSAGRSSSIVMLPVSDKPGE